MAAQGILNPLVGGSTPSGPIDLLSLHGGRRIKKVPWPTILDPDLDEELELLFEEITRETEITVPGISQQDAYEANKTRDTCIVCGKKTKQSAVFFSVIQYCPCVEKLAKLDT